jgi:hypothetical protein
MIGAGRVHYEKLINPAVIHNVTLPCESFPEGSDAPDPYRYQNISFFAGGDYPVKPLPTVMCTPDCYSAEAGKDAQLTSNDSSE